MRKWGVWADGSLLRPFLTKEEAESFNDGLKNKGTVAEIKWIKDAKYLAGQRPEKVAKDYEGYVGKVRRHTIQKNVEPMDKAEHVRLTVEYFEGGRKPIHCAWHIITGQDINVKS